SECSAFIVAAQETTASTMAWMLFEPLSRNPDVQQAIHQEILEARARYPDRRLTTKDYDELPLLNAAFKESLRCYTVSPYVSRMASCDDVLPLAEPIVTTDGRTITSIPLKKGQSVEVAAHIYNRNPAVWGEDAHVWRPARFLEKMDKQVSLGLYSSLATFSGGVRGCIGWRFACVVIFLDHKPNAHLRENSVMEAQALAAELIENFRFEPPEDLTIRRAPGLLMTAKIVGQKDHQPHMPLKVTPLIHT
ncbi:cytochrome P450, partial [Cylindrobasidium torrendii FP15055 ss-10]